MEQLATSVTLTAQMGVSGGADDALADFDKLVPAYWPRVYRFVLASLRDAEAAETVTQDCFWRAYRSRASFRREASVNTWLMRIAVNLIRDRVRNRRLQFWKRATATAVAPSEIAEWATAGQASPEARTLAGEQVAAVWEATKTLASRQREVFLLRFVEEMEILEIAQATGLTEGAVKTHLFRAVHAIRKRLGVSA